MKDNSKNTVIILLAIAAIAVAVFSAYRTFFGNPEKVVGSLGDMSGERGAAKGGTSGGTPVVGGGGKEAEKSGGDAASGAPPGAEFSGSGTQSESGK